MKFYELGDKAKMNAEREILREIQNAQLNSKDEDAWFQFCVSAFLRYENIEFKEIDFESAINNYLPTHLPVSLRAELLTHAQQIDEDMCFHLEIELRTTAEFDEHGDLIETDNI